MDTNTVRGRQAHLPPRMREQTGREGDRVRREPSGPRRRTGVPAARRHREER
ncbi:MAG TPA: hypothetical protein VLK55_06445 [Kocuria rosea]|nr:hypothetical protein [Kocuria rosea]